VVDFDRLVPDGGGPSADAESVNPDLPRSGVIGARAKP
jgi:hypothetical protein